MRKGKGQDERCHGTILERRYRTDNRFRSCFLWYGIMERLLVHNSFADRVVGLRLRFGTGTGTRLGSRKWNRWPRRHTLVKRWREGRVK